MDKFLFNGVDISKLKIIKECKRFNLKDKNFNFYKCKIETDKVFIWSYGIDVCKKKAKTKAFLEGLERYCICLNQEKKKRLILKSYDKIKSQAIHPRFLFSFSNSQYSQKDFKFNKLNKDDKIYWVKGQSFLTNRRIYIPASYVYCDYQLENSEKKLGHSTSNGCAIGRTLNEAILNGILELIERDAILIRWFNKLPSDKINSKYLSNALKKTLKEVMEDYKINILINDQTTDFNIPTVSVLSQSYKSPYFTFGSAASFSIETAIIKALQESLLIREELGSLKTSSLEYRDFNNIQILYEHAEFYAIKNEIKAFDFLFQSSYGTNLKKYQIMESKYNTTEKQLTFLQDFCKKTKKDIIFVDLSDKILKGIGLYVVRVVIPSLYSLNSEYNGRYLANKRLFSLPLKLGFNDYNLDEANINQYPHPIG